MSFGLTYEQLTPVAGKVRAGIVSYNGDNPEHRTVLREALPRFLGSLGAVHGEAFPSHHIDAVMGVANAKEIEIDFFLAALDACCPVLIGGLATGAPTFGAECDENNNLRIYPVKHGEDLCVDKHLAKLFREYTRCQLHPDGIGAGTWLMREQIRRSVIDPDWVFSGRDNEHSPDNPPILGLMDKFGAIRGTERDSAVLQLNGLTDAMKQRWRIPVVTQALPADALGISPSPSNFLTRWSSADGKQQIAVIYTKIASTFDGQPVVWTKIKSNGNLPGDMLKEVLVSLLAAGCNEISNRRWGSSREKMIVERECPLIPILGSPQEMQAALNAAYRDGLLIQPERTDLSHVFGGPVPVMHIHLNNERQILEALLRMDAMYRKFGNHTMLSGVMSLNNVQNPQEVFGRRPPQATEVHGIDPARDACKPHFELVPGTNKDLTQRDIPERPSAVGSTNNGKALSLAA